MAWLTQEKPIMMGYLMNLVRNPDLAEDLYQQTCVAAVESFDRYDPSRDFGTWARGIARNLALSSFRRDRRTKTVPPSSLLLAIDAAYAAESDAEREITVARLTRLRDATASLPARHRELLKLRYRDGLSLRQIAVKLGRNERAVQVALSRVRSRLQNCIVQREANSP